MDMYTRVKRERVPIKRDLYGVPINDDGRTCGSSLDDSTDGTLTS